MIAVPFRSLRALAGATGWLLVSLLLCVVPTPAPAAAAADEAMAVPAVDMPFVSGEPSATPAPRAALDPPRDPAPDPAPDPGTDEASGAPGVTAASPIGFDPLAGRYQLGQGLSLGHGFTLGGYGAFSVADTDGPEDRRAGLDALSAILWWDDARWRFFGELELADAFVARTGDIGSDDARLVLERFYFDYFQRDEIKLRLGKFLTPVGRWNLIHAAPLVWTTSRPLITESTFPTNATGAMVHGLLPIGDQGIEYSIYASPGEELFPEPHKPTFREAYGLHLSGSPLPHLETGFSFVDFELDEGVRARRKLYGVDLQWAVDRFELSAEYVHRTSRLHLESRDEQGGYVQAVVPLSTTLYAVARYEQFRGVQAPERLRLYLGGLNYRPRPGLVFKAEYVESDVDAVSGEPRTEDGFRASIAVLF
ncbi:MAG TPA: hypothetical protein VGE57_11730 [Solimonas sp.]